MKFIVSIFLLLSLVLDSNITYLHEDKLGIESSIKAVYTILPNAQGPKYYLIGIKLVNVSDSTFEFLTTTCGTIGNVVFDSQDVSPVIGKCINNQITTIKLDPNQEFTFTFLVKADKKYTGSLKIGWVLMTYENTVVVNNYIKTLEYFRDKLENVIWAKPLELKNARISRYDIK